MARTERRRRGPSRFATVMGALLIVLSGFAAGALAGFTFEEPGLVFAYLTGRTVDVDLASLDAEGPIPPVAAPGPSPLGSGEPTEQPAADATAGAAPSPSAAPPDGFAVQVGAFESPSSADRLRGSLLEHGLPAYVVEGDGNSRWRVRVGPLATRGEAEQLAQRLRAEHRLPTWILHP